MAFLPGHRDARRRSGRNRREADDACPRAPTHLAGAAFEACAPRTPDASSEREAAWAC